MTKSELDRKKWAVRGININTDVFLRKRKARFTWDYDLNAFRQVDRVVEKTSDLSPLLAAFEDGNDSDKEAKLNSLVQSMIKTSHTQAMTLLDKVKEGSEEEFFVM